MIEITKETNYYFIQVFLTDAQFRCEHFIVFADNKSEATKKAAEYCQTHWPNQVSDIRYYHKNYIRDARRLIVEGKYC
jgi:hypothetical protein